MKIIVSAKTRLTILPSLCCLAVAWMVVGCSEQTSPNTSTSGPVSASEARAVVKIGAILPLTGDLAKYGKTSQAAIELALHEVNAIASNSGLTFKAIFEDDAMNTARGVSAAKKLIEVDKVDAIIGPLASSITLAAAPVAERAQVVLLSPGSSTPAVADAGEFIFRNCLSDEFEGGQMAKLVQDDLKSRRIAVYHINNDFGVGLAKVFRKATESAGGQIVLEETFSQGSRDHRSALTKIKAAAADAVYLAGYDEMISVFRQAKELEIKVQWLGTTFLSDQSLVDKMNGDADGTVLAAWVYRADSDEPRIRHFVDKVQQKTGGISPDVFSANAYDAVYLLAEAVRLRGVRPTQLREGLLAIRDYNGVTGKTTFQPNGDVKKPIEFKRIINGKLTPFQPANP